MATSQNVTFNNMGDQTSSVITYPQQEDTWLCKDIVKKIIEFIIGTPSSCPRFMMERAKDLISLSRVCHLTHNAINGDQACLGNIQAGSRLVGKWVTDPGEPFKQYYVGLKGEWTGKTKRMTY